MSVSVFPDVIGQTNWKFRLPVKKTPSFHTIIQTPENRVGEIRIALQTYPRWEFEYDLAYMLGDATPAQITSAYQSIVGFYGQMKGAANDWLYFDPDDNGSSKTQRTLSLGLADLQQNSIGTGDGVTTDFSLTRPIGALTDLIQNFHTGYPLVYKAGVLQTAAQYSINFQGTLHFVTAPAAGNSITWAGQWYFRCRFLDDQWDNLQSIKQRMWKNSSIKFISLLA